MNTLIVIAFNEIGRASAVQRQLTDMQRDYLVDIEDAVVVNRDGDGKVHIRQSVNLTANGALYGGLWGGLIGLILAGPLGLILAGGTSAAFGALAGSLSDYGIDDDFIKRLGGELQPNSSALFVLLRQMVEDKVLDELRGIGGTILQTSLSKEAEERLKQVMQAAPTATA